MKINNYREGLIEMKLEKNILKPTLSKLPKMYTCMKII